MTAALRFEMFRVSGDQRVRTAGPCDFEEWPIGTVWEHYSRIAHADVFPVELDKIEQTTDISAFEAKQWPSEYLSVFAMDSIVVEDDEPPCKSCVNDAARRAVWIEYA